MAGKSQSEGSSGSESMFNVMESSYPEFEANNLFLMTVMHDVQTITDIIKTMDSYQDIRLGLLVDNVIQKILNEETRENVKQEKKRLVDEYTKNVSDHDEYTKAIVDANMEALGMCMSHFNKYFTFEKKLVIGSV